MIIIFISLKMTFKLLKNRTHLIAEIGWNFLGNLALAKKMIVLAKKNGADAVKFQIWDPKNLKKGPWDNDGRRKIYEKAYLSKEKYTQLYKFSKKQNLKCFASVFSEEDINTLASVSNQIVKIPSPEAYNIKLIEKSLKIFKQVIISVGCLKFNELKKLLKYKKNKKLVVLHCVSSYPLKPEKCNFEKYFYLKKHFSKVGYSGHLEGIEDANFAIANGAFLIEKHFTSNNLLPGRDNKFALTPKDFKKMSIIRDLYKKFFIFNGMGLQKSEVEVFRKYRGRWIKK